MKTAAPAPVVPMPAAPVPPAAAAGASKAATMKAARAFEAMALGQMLQPMFETIDVKDSMFGGGEAEETWRPMLVDEIAKKIAAHGGLGIAGPVYAQMLRAQEAAPAADETTTIPQTPKEPTP